MAACKETVDAQDNVVNVGDWRGDIVAVETSSSVTSLRRHLADNARKVSKWACTQNTVNSWVFAN